MKHLQSNPILRYRIQIFSIVHEPNYGTQFYHGDWGIMCPRQLGNISHTYRKFSSSNGPFLVSGNTQCLRAFRPIMYSNRTTYQIVCIQLENDRGFRSGTLPCSFYVKVVIRPVCREGRNSTLLEMHIVWRCPFSETTIDGRRSVQFHRYNVAATVLTRWMEIVKLSTKGNTNNGPFE